MALVADTSGLIALINGADAAHDAVRRVVEREAGPVIVPDLVIAEVDYLLLSRVGREAEEAFLDDVAGGGFTRAPLRDEDLDRAIEVLRRFRDRDVGIVDATVVATAQRLGVDRILTLDLRHFRSFRFAPRRGFVLLPADA